MQELKEIQQIHLSYKYSTQTADSSDEEIETLYQEVTNNLSKSKNRDVKLVMGDWNVKVGLNNKSEACGLFGLGERNNRGDDITN